MISSSVIKFPGWLWSLIGLCVLLALITPNPMLSVFSLVVLIFITKLLMRKWQPPVLLFVAVIQWLQASAKIFHANINNATVAEFGFAAKTEYAIWLSLVGVVVLAVGMRAAIGSGGTVNVQKLNYELSTLSLTRLFYFYAFTFLMEGVLVSLSHSIMQLSQILVAVSSLKWVAFFLLLLAIVVQQKNKIFVALLVVIEVAKGFIGYFAGFKLVFFYTLITFGTINFSWKFKNIMPVILAACMLGYFTILWTGIKGDYRAELSGGRTAQVSVLSITEKFEQLFSLSKGMSTDKILYSVDQTLYRVAYVDFFAEAIAYVPTSIEHQQGRIWGKSILHILSPRVLFPDKAVLESDSEITMKYTGLNIASGSEGTSISIGYMGESYIDFGVPFMFIPIFLLGLLWGSIYRYFIKRSHYMIFGFAFAIAVLINAYQLEMTSLKLLGNMVMRFLVLAIVLRFIEQRLFNWLSVKISPSLN